MKKFFIAALLTTLCTSASFGAGRYRGDLNGDDRVDLADMVHLARSINSGKPDPAFDINNSGKVDDSDLHKLADIIVSGILTEDDGFNVGIGGWDDDGNDYGGTVRSSFNGTGARSAEEMNFYINSPKSCGEKRKYSVELGIANASEAACCMLFNIRIPGELQFDNESILELESSLLATHKVYGKINVKREYDYDPYSSNVLRFIIFSPDLSPLKDTVGTLGRIYYSTDEAWGAPEFFECQVLSEGYDEVMTVPTHQSDYILWRPTNESLKVWYELPTFIADSQTVNYVKVYENDGDNVYRAFNMHFVLPEGIRVNKIKQGREEANDITLSDRATSTHSISCNMPDATTLKITCTSSQNDNLYNTDLNDEPLDYLFTVGLIAESTLAPGEYEIYLDGINFVFNDADVSVPANEPIYGTMVVKASEMGIDVVEVEESDVDDCYDLQGRKVDPTQVHGTVVISKGTKVFVK